MGSDTGVDVHHEWLSDYDIMLTIKSHDRSLVIWRQWCVVDDDDDDYDHHE